MSQPPAPRKTPPSPPLWRQAYDAAERAIAPRADDVVRSEYFALGTALLRRAQNVAGGSVQGLSARAWHLVNLPAGSDISRLRAQIGALDREVRRLTIQLEQERRRGAASRPDRSRPTTPTTEDSDADGAQPADGARPRPARRRAQHPPRP
jgi:hypothetical protein